LVPLYERLELTAFGAQDRWHFVAFVSSAPRRQLKRIPLGASPIVARPDEKPLESPPVKLCSARGARHASSAHTVRPAHHAIPASHCRQFALRRGTRLPVSRPITAGPARQPSVTQAKAQWIAAQHDLWCVRVRCEPKGTTGRSPLAPTPNAVCVSVIHYCQVAVDNG
jgi:hypothetical protein